jgi:flagellar biosynthesis GTPase FlhF
MTRKQRLKLIDEINDEFIAFLRDYRGSRYEKYFKNINDRIIENANSLTPALINAIVAQETEGLDTEDVAIFGMILGAITTILENARLNREQRQSVAPIIGMIGIFAITSPKTFVRKTYTSLKAPKSANEKRVSQLLNNYKTTHQEELQEIQRKQKEALMRSQREAKLGMSKRVIRDMNELVQEGKDTASQQRALRRKYNASKALNRTIDTEMHSNLETAKLEQSRNMGFTKKQWRTQGDSRVRSTPFHNQVANKIVDIDKDFNIGRFTASAPGDSRLPPGERINCRCYLVYK